MLSKTRPTLASRENTSSGFAPLAPEGDGDTCHLARVLLVTLVAFIIAALSRPVSAEQTPGQIGWQHRPGHRGIEVAVVNTTDIFINARGGSRPEAGISNLIEMALSFDLATLVGLEGGSIYLLGLGTHGSDPADAVGAVHAPSNLAATDAFRLFELWYEHRLLDDKVAALVGLFAVDSEFDAKSTADLFINGGFGTGLDLSETGRNGPSIFPVTSFGMRLRMQPAPGWSVQAAVLDGVPGDPDDPDATTIRFGDGDGVFAIAEGNFESSGPMRLRLGFGGWRYTTDLEDVAATRADGKPVVRGGSSGLYGFVEASLYAEPGGFGQGLAGYLRLGRADADTNRFGGYYGAGLVYTGLLPGRDRDMAGFGISSAVNGAPFRDRQRQLGAGVDTAETVFEWTYRAELRPSISLQPVIQYLLNPDTDPGLRDSLALGLRIGIDLL